MLEAVGLACYLMPMEKRPLVLYAGNHKLANEVKELLGAHVGQLEISHNVRPSLETEDLEPGRHELALLMMKLRQRQIKGVDELHLWSAGNLLPTAYAQGRIIRFLSKLYESTRGLLCVNVGASATSVAAGFNGELTLGVYPQYGLGENLAGLLQQTDINDIVRWLQLDISPNMLREYMFQKSLYPSSVPATKDEQAIAQAIARQALYLAVRAAQKDFPAHARSARKDTMPPLDLITPHLALFADDRMKELVVTPKGVRFVARIWQAVRANYVTFREIKFPGDRVEKELARELLDAAIDLSQSLIQSKPLGKVA
jgi:hypothetical protein